MRQAALDASDVLVVCICCRLTMLTCPLAATAGHVRPWKGGAQRILALQQVSAICNWECTSKFPAICNVAHLCCRHEPINAFQGGLSASTDDAAWLLVQQAAVCNSQTKQCLAWSQLQAGASHVEAPLCPPAAWA